MSTGCSRTSSEARRFALRGPGGLASRWAVLRAVGGFAVGMAVVCALSGVSLRAGTVPGIVRTVARGGVAPAPAIVYAEAIDAPPAKVARRFTLSQKNKTFQPRVLAVPLGSTVDFPNNDGIYHNVFSLSGPQPFDLGLYRAGETRPRT